MWFPMDVRQQRLLPKSHGDQLRGIGFDADGNGPPRCGHACSQAYEPLMIGRTRGDLRRIDEHDTPPLLEPSHEEPPLVVDFLHTNF